ncbi:MAG: hypothetical protein Mars2KO_44400 [Maribacter sp.]
MPAFTNWEKVKRYGESDLKYKDLARALLTKSLGFEPPVQLSMLGEVAIRKTLREIDEGQDKQKTLENKISIYTDVINNVIPRYRPEYNHLLTKQS